MAELQQAAEQFAQDLVGLNIAGLMMMFTPAGMEKAMALQAQRQAAGQQQLATGYEVRLQGEDAGSHVVDIVLKNANGEAVLVTRWLDVAGAWKVDDLAVRQD
jgi:hypothetical protein